MYRGRAKVRAKNSLWNGLQGWWRLDEASGDALDSSGNGYDGTITGATQNVSGHINTAYSFDGVNDQVVISNATFLSTFTGISTLTISFWAKAVDFDSSEVAVALADSSTNNSIYMRPYYLSGKNEHSYVYYDGSGFLNAAITVTMSTWNHFCYVQRSATDHELFVNGTSIDTATTSKTVPATIDGLYIGAHDLTDDYEGEIDHVQIWDRALTNTEISWLSNY